MNKTSSTPIIEFSHSENMYNNYLKAYFTARQFQFEETGNYFLSVVKLGGPKNLIMDALICHILGGDVNKAITLINEYKLEEQNYYLGLISLLEKFKNNKLEEREKLTHLILKDDELNLVSVLQAWVKFEKGLTKEGIELLEKILQANGDSLESDAVSDDILLQIALMYDLKDEKEKAKIYYDKLASTPSAYMNVISLIIANFYERNNFLAEAKNIYLEYHKGNPLNFLFLKEQDNLSKSNTTTRVITDSKEALSFYIIGLGDFLINRFNAPKVINQSLFYYQIANFLSDSPFAKLALTQTLIHYQNKSSSANLKRSLDIINTASSPNKTIEYWKNLRMAEIYSQMNKLDQAQTVLKKIIQENPLMFDNYLFLSEILKKEKLYQNMVKLYDEYLDNLQKFNGALSENIWPVYLMKGEAYDLLGQYTEAAVNYQKALEIRPDNPSALNNLAYNWLEQKQHLDEAEKLLLKAYALRPKDHSILDSLAWCYYLKGDFLKAEKYAEKSVDFMPNDPITNEHLGDIYYKLGRKTEALYQWNYALECIEITPAALERIQGKIRSLE
jgi:tetratricopeptide (TPR) repeat protein